MVWGGRHLVLISGIAQIDNGFQITFVVLRIETCPENTLC